MHAAPRCLKARRIEAQVWHCRIQRPVHAEPRIGPDRLRHRTTESKVVMKQRPRLCELPGLDGGYDGTHDRLSGLARARNLRVDLEPLHLRGLGPLVLASRHPVLHFAIAAEA